MQIGTIYRYPYKKGRKEISCAIIYMPSRWREVHLFTFQLNIIMYVQQADMIHIGSEAQ